MNSPPDESHGALVDEPARLDVHGEHDQRPEQQVSPVAHEAQPLDENSLDEDHRHERAEDIAESAQDRIGDGEGRQHDAEVQVLDVCRVVGVDGAADAGDEATGGERADLHRRQVDADALSGQLVLADGPQNGARA